LLAVARLQTVLQLLLPRDFIVHVLDPLVSVFFGPVILGSRFEGLASLAVLLGIEVGHAQYQIGIIRALYTAALKPLYYGIDGLLVLFIVQVNTAQARIELTLITLG
jgi:hypothetical protein